MTRLGLVGCVKGKLPVPAPAAQLYTSPLFRLRRGYVERTCDAWYVLSAKHGLVPPHHVLEPYDQTLKRATRAERRDWSRQVLAALQEQVGPLDGLAVDIHAGDEYRAYGLVDGLIAAGASVDVPTAGLSIGRQLAFYKDSEATAT